MISIRCAFRSLQNRVSSRKEENPLISSFPVYSRSVRETRMIHGGSFFVREFDRQVFLNFCSVGFEMLCPKATEFLMRMKGAAVCDWMVGRSPAAHRAAMLPSRCMTEKCVVVAE